MDAVELTDELREKAEQIVYTYFRVLFGEDKISKETIGMFTEDDLYHCFAEFGLVHDRKESKSKPIMRLAVVSLYERGNTIADIAVITGVDKSTVGLWLKEKGAKRRLQTCTCPVCGKEFEAISSAKKYCSNRCESKANRHVYRMRRRNSYKDGRMDKDISIEGLYAMDNGVCYLCGGKCDFNDFKIIKGTKCCGNTYPSVDHVIPVSKGGSHTWDNVKLAHRSCNSRKRAKIYGEQEVESKN